MITLQVELRVIERGEIFTNYILLQINFLNRK
jgi:hypothetical protein